MPNFDLPLAQLREYRPTTEEPSDFDAFWADTLARSRGVAQPAQFEPVASPLRTVDVYDVTFSGYLGQPIRAWLLLPRQVKRPLPAVVQYVGYGGGRGLSFSRLLWPSAGYASFVMDTRGQGSSWSPGDTPDVADGIGPAVPGVMTRGIADPASYYYRRLMTDAALAVDAVREHADIDGERIVVTGASQGGGLALAAAAFGKGVSAALIDVPFLCHYRRALELTEDLPYGEISRYLSVHRGEVETVFRTLSYFDGVNLAARATAPALFSVGLFDTITPPSTVFAAYNNYAGPRDIRVWSFNGHDAGELDHQVEQMAYLERLGIAPE